MEANIRKKEKHKDKENQDKENQDKDKDNFAQNYNHKDDNDNYENNSQKSMDTTKLTKLDIILLNNGWNDKNEQLVVGIGYNCGIYKQLHEQTSFRYKRFNKIINLSLLIFSIFLTTDSILSLLQGEVLLIVQKIIIFIIAIISVLNNFLKYSELSIQHAHSASSFNLIYNEIRNMMCVYRKDRFNAVKYIQNMMKEYDHLEISSSEIPADLITKIESKVKKENSNINMPTNHFREIEVIIDDGTNDIQMSSIGETPKKLSPSKFRINNMQNLTQIHNCFKIDGELSENDNININDLENYRRNGINLQTQYEFNRFMRH
jgi:hypothetical protein